jgi:hypothetical protein
MKKEWESEPNELRFESSGFKCLIKRNSLGALCGYVALPPGHPYYGKDYKGMNVDVHGELTWGRLGDDEYGFDKGYYWVGFDCAHAFDYVPEMQNFLQHYSMDFDSATSYKNIEYVKNELIKLAEQLVPLNMAIKKLKGDD